MTTTETFFVAEPDLRAWAVRVFERVSLSNEDAETAADVLVTANLRGVDTHGIIRMPLYVQRIREGANNAKPNIRVECEKPGSLLVDGDFGLGMVVSAWAMREAIRRARTSGAFVVGVKRSGHFGAAGYYAQMASAADMIGLVCTNAGPSMAPWGSTSLYLGNNPLAIAAPGGIPGGLVLDMATSQVAWGKVMLAARAGKKIPFGWATDSQGRPTDDPEVGMKGLMVPMGGYKGYGLTVMFEILAGILTGATFGPYIVDEYAQPLRPQDVGHFLMVVDVESFMPSQIFKSRIQQFVDEIHACQPMEGVERIYVPGEVELQVANRRRTEGIPLSGDLNNQLVQLGEQVGEPFPAMG